MLAIVLSILKFVGTAITGILGIVGITTETHEDKEFAPKVSGGKARIRRVLTPQGRKILRWTIVGFAVAVAAQVGEETRSYLEGEKADARANSMLTNATQSLVHITRMVSRFESVSLEAAYKLNLTNRTLLPLRTFLGKAYSSLPKDQLPTGLSQIGTDDTNAPFALTLDIEELTLGELRTDTSLCKALKQLLDPNMVLDIYEKPGDRDPSFATFSSVNRSFPEVAYLPADKCLAITYRVSFPRNAWYQERLLMTADDLSGKCVQVGFQDNASSMLAGLVPDQLILRCDEREIKLDDFREVTPETRKLRLESRKKLVNQRVKFGGLTLNVKSNVTLVTLKESRARFRKDPARGDLIAIYETSVPAE